MLILSFSDLFFPTSKGSKGPRIIGLRKMIFLINVVRGSKKKRAVYGVLVGAQTMPGLRGHFDGLFKIGLRGILEIGLRGILEIGLTRHFVVHA